MAKIELYIFGEVVNFLGISSNELNELIMSAKLVPVRHQGRLKFKKADVDLFKQTFVRDRKAEPKPVPAGETTPSDNSQEEKPLTLLDPSRQVKPESEFLTWQEAIAELQISDQALQQLTEAGQLDVYEGREGLKLKRSQVMEIKPSLSGDASAASGQPKATAAETKPATAELQLNLDVPELPITVLPDINHIKPQEKSGDYYSVDQALSLLQMDRKMLDRLIDDGEITAIHLDGKLRLKKSEVEVLRHERMLNATLMIEPEKVVEEEEDIKPILISANSEIITPVNEPSSEEFYTFDEAGYELQITPAALKRMVAHQEIEPIRGADGQLKFHKADVERLAPHKKIEPTVILPDEIESKVQEETRALEQPEAVAKPFVYLPGKTEAIKGEKMFYTLEEAGNFLDISDKKLQEYLASGSIKAYRYEGQPQFKRNDLLKLADEVKKYKSSPAKSAPAQKQDTLGFVQDYPSAYMTAEQGDPAKSAVAKAKPPAKPTEPQYYTMDEVKGLLKSDEKEIKMMVARGQLKVNRSEKGYLFLQESVNSLVKKEELVRTEVRKLATDTRPKQILEDDYTPLPVEIESLNLMEAAKFLGIGKADIHRLVKDKKLQMLSDQRFSKKDLERLRQSKDVEATMLLPLLEDDMEMEEDKIGYIAAPAKSHLKTTVKAPELRDKNAPKPPLAVATAKPEAPAPKKTPAHAATSKAAAKPVHEITESDMRRFFYTWQEALTMLQLEAETLNAMIQQGMFKQKMLGEKLWLRKSDVDAFIRGKMIEPTLVVQDAGDNAGQDLFDDEDDDDMFFLK